MSLLERWRRWRRWRSLRRFSAPLIKRGYPFCHRANYLVRDWSQFDTAQLYPGESFVIYGMSDAERRRAMRSGIDWPGAE